MLSIVFYGTFFKSSTTYSSSKILFGSCQSTASVRPLLTEALDLGTVCPSAALRD